MKNDFPSGGDESGQYPALIGIVLSGGESLRMGSDKAALDYHGLPQRIFLYKLLLPFCKTVFISCNLQQASGITSVPFIVDAYPKIGPLGGILTAMEAHPGKAILSLPCDLPLLDTHTVTYLIQHRNPTKIATTLMNADSRKLEPLLTIWEPTSYNQVLNSVVRGFNSPYRVLADGDVEVVTAPDARVFLNINTPEEYQLATSAVKKETRN